MKTSRFSDSQILAILKQAEASTPVPEICSEQGISFSHVSHMAVETWWYGCVVNGPIERVGRLKRRHITGQGVKG
jgi:hypothetical protein